MSSASLITLPSLDDVPLTEKEEIALVLEAIVLSKPSPLATKRTLFTPGDSNLFKVKCSSPQERTTTTCQIFY